MHTTEACLASSTFSSPLIKRTSALESDKIYTPWKRGGELGQIYEHKPQWQGTGSCYLTFEIENVKENWRRGKQEIGITERWRGLTNK